MQVKGAWVKCPKCKQTQKFYPRKKTIVGTKKRCVICGSVFITYRNIRENNVVEWIK